MSTNISKWDVEDAGFWEASGRKVAYKNLWDPKLKFGIPNYKIKKVANDKR